MPLTATVRALRMSLPDGRSLSEADWRARHTVMTWVLAVHVPVIVGYALVTGASPGHALVEALLPALLVAVAVGHGDRRTRSLAVSLGLITCSAVFVHLSGGLIEWHFHYFVSLALVALYQEWLVYLMALAFVVVQHGLGSWLRFNDVYNHGNGELWWALVHGGFVLAASACHIATWRFNESATARAEGYLRELHDGEASLMARLEATAQMRSDLIATASHEFRTPLTAIGGAATTLQHRSDDLTPDDRDQLLATIVGRSERLGQMLESMLIAAEVEPPETAAATPLASVVTPLTEQCQHEGEVALDVGQVWVACGRRPLSQLVERLIDSARRQGDEGACVRLLARAEDDQVLLRVSVVAAGLDDEAVASLLEPFRGGTDVIPRSADVGLGLYAVRRIAEVHGGGIDVALRDGSLVIDVRLPAASPVPAQPRGARHRSSAVG